MARKCLPKVATISQVHCITIYGKSNKMANVSFPGLFCISENYRGTCFLKQAILCWPGCDKAVYKEG